MHIVRRAGRLVVVAVLLIGSASAIARAGQQSPLAFVGQSQAPTAPAAPKLDINTATATQLDALPGVGPRTAELILEYRQAHGGFKKIEELMNIRGIGEKSFLELRELVTVGPLEPTTASTDPR
jgi:competence protein ComEA